MKFEQGDKNFTVVNDNHEAVGEITYSEAGEHLWIIDHTYVEDAYRGQNLAQELVLKVVESAREHNKKIMPLCPFAASEFRKHPEYSDVKS